MDKDDETYGPLKNNLWTVTLKMKKPTSNKNVRVSTTSQNRTLPIQYYQFNKSLSN